MLPPFPTEEHFKQTDDELGRDLLAWWIAYNAERKGLDPYNVPIEIQERIVFNSRPMDGDSIHCAGLEKAIKRAAQAEYAKAGAMIRELFADGIINSVCRDEAVTGRRRQIHNRKGKTKQKTNPTNKDMTMAEMRKWRNEGHTFNGFIDAALNGSVDGMEIDRVIADEGNNKGKEVIKFSLKDGKEEERTVSAVKDWWTDSVKS